VSTHAYYERNAESFFARSVGIDMAPLRDRFSARLARGAHILDAGCGSGRDSLAFRELGFRVTSFDASSRLCELARAHVGGEVRQMRFDEAPWNGVFDGLWASASLLHVSVDALPETVSRLLCALKPGGLFYLSFKHGPGPRIEGARSFSDFEPDTLRRLLEAIPELITEQIWASDSRRPAHPQRWVNALVRRAPPSSEPPRLPPLATGELDA
jgi:SAM-dependent methyltransferase